MAVTTTQFLDAVKRGCSFPTSQPRFSDANLLKFADEELEATILPMITSIRQEFFVKSKNVPTVSNQAAYKIPYRTIGRTLRDIKLLDSSGTIVRALPLVNEEEAHVYTNAVSGDPRACYVQGENLIILPTPQSSSFYLQMIYPLAPSKLVPVSEAGYISSFDLTTGVVTISASISGFSSGVLMDIVDGSSGCTVKAEDITNVSVSGTSITFSASDLPSNIAVGDYVTLSNQTPVVGLPQEAHQCLVQATICRILEAQGDMENYGLAQKSLEKKMGACQQLLNPRIEGRTPVVLTRRGLLTQRPFSYQFKYRL